MSNFGKATRKRCRLTMRRSTVLSPALRSITSAEPAKAASEMYRVLKPGGRAVIVDVIVSDNAEEAALQNAIEIIRDPTHIRMLPEAELFSEIKDAGFTPRHLRVEKDREFEEWCGIANDAQRIGPLRTIAHTLARDSRHAGFGLSVNDQDELVFSSPLALDRCR